MTIDVRPATADRWDDLVEVMGNRGDPSRCWCQFFRFHRSDLRDCSVADLRGMLRDQVTAAGPPPGVLAYRDGVPAGWCAVAPKDTYARLRSSPISRAASTPPSTPASPAASTTAPDAGDVWAVTCFVVRVGHRRHGVAAALLDGAVTLAAEHGATTVEAYPIDPAARPNVTSAELYHGPLSVFLAAGFTEARRPSPARPVVRLTLPT